MQRFLIEMRHYRRGMGMLSMVALFGVVNMICALFDSSFSLILAPAIPTLVFSYASVLSEMLKLPLLLRMGVFFALCLTVAWFYLRHYAKKHSAVMIAATVIYAGDLFVLFGFSVLFGYSFGLLDGILRLFVLVALVRGSVASVRIGRMPPPDTSELERMLQGLVPVESTAEIGDHVGDLPAEESDTLPLREAVPRRRVFFDARCFDLQISVVRSRGLTELCVDGKVYAEVRGMVELFYVLTATVNGHRITVRLVPGILRATMILTVDGYLLGRCHRYF